MREGLALLYSDGSMGVLPSGADLEQARREARESDVNETDPSHFTQLVRVRIEITEHLDVPERDRERASGRCPNCGERIQTNDGEAA